jgi:hypothetical protein
MKNAPSVSGYSLVFASPMAAYFLLFFAAPLVVLDEIDGMEGGAVADLVKILRASSSPLAWAGARGGKGRAGARGG